MDLGSSNLACSHFLFAVLQSGSVSCAVHGIRKRRKPAGTTEKPAANPLQQQQDWPQWAPNTWTTPAPEKQGAWTDSEAQPSQRVQNQERTKLSLRINKLEIARAALNDAGAQREVVESLDQQITEAKAAISAQRPIGSRVDTCTGALERSIALRPKVIAVEAANAKILSASVTIGKGTGRSRLRCVVVHAPTECAKKCVKEEFWSSLAKRQKVWRTPWFSSMPTHALDLFTHVPSVTLHR